MATYSSILVWEIAWTEEPPGLESIGLQEFTHDLVTEPAETPTHRKGDTAVSSPAAFSLCLGEVGGGPGASGGNPPPFRDPLAA